METLFQDLRYAMRQLRRSPGFTIAALVTLAMAIGANAIVFGVLNGLILRPLNVPDAQSLYLIERASDNSTDQSYPDYLDLQNRNHSFDGLTGYAITQVSLNPGEGPSLIWGVEASSNYFDALRIRPHLGRFFHDSDDHGPNSAPYIVLSYAYWHTQFHDDRSVLGRVVQVNGHPFTVIGVAPKDFPGTIVFVSPSFFVPLIDHEQIDGATDLNKRGTRWIFMVVGHLKPGTTLAAATADLNSIASYLQKTYPRDERPGGFALGRPNLLGDWFAPAVQAFIAGLMLLAALILLAACANLGSLFAARAADRSREVAMRLALGASHSRLLRTLFSEAVLISLAGGVVGLWASVVFLRWLSQWQPFGNFPMHTPVSADARVYVMALALSLISGFIFGAVPVRQVLRTDPYQVIKTGSSAPTARRIGAREVLLAVQIALCAVLVTSSLVAVRGLVHSLRSNFGFEPKNSILVGADLRMGGYSNDRAPAVQKRLLEGITAIPGVDSVGLTDALLLNDQSTSSVFADQTTDLRPANAAMPNVYLYHVSPEYLRAEGTSLLAGRSFSWQDEKNSSRVAVINQEFAHRIFGSVEKAIGAYYKMPDGTRIQVIGVAQNGKYGKLTEEPQPAMFLPILQWPSNSAWMVVRSRRNPEQIGAAIRSAMQQLAPGVPVVLETRLDEIGGALFPPEMATVVLGVLGAMGALLAITGIFGMAAYSVSKRMRELGIRVALGAQRRQIVQAALERPLRLLAFGSTAGLILGLLASRVLSDIVFQATPRDPVVLAGVVFAMAMLGLIATWIPARRALMVDPVLLLRQE
ncbi:MAG TPA: ABC transporter permease [Terriglobales bacterium]|nr:ABC transporter permease [Terriglobales bacterium]